MIHPWLSPRVLPPHVLACCESICLINNSLSKIVSLSCSDSISTSSKSVRPHGELHSGRSLLHWKMGWNACWGSATSYAWWASQSRDHLWFMETTCQSSTTPKDQSRNWRRSRYRYATISAENQWQWANHWQRMRLQRRTLQIWLQRSLRNVPNANIWYRSCCVIFIMNTTDTPVRHRECLGSMRGYSGSLASGWQIRSDRK